MRVVPKQCHAWWYTICIIIIVILYIIIYIILEEELQQQWPGTQAIRYLYVSSLIVSNTDFDERSRADLTDLDSNLKRFHTRDCNK